MSKDITDTAEQIIETLLPHMTCEHDYDGDGRHYSIEYDLDSKGMAKLEQLLSELIQPKVTRTEIAEISIKTVGCPCISETLEDWISKYAEVKDE